MVVAFVVLVEALRAVAAQPRLQRALQLTQLLAEKVLYLAEEQNLESQGQSLYLRGLRQSLGRVPALFEAHEAVDRCLPSNLGHRRSKL